MKRIVRGLMVDGLAIAGFAAVVRGMQMAWPPLAWIVGGVLAVVVAGYVGRRVGGEP